MSKKPTLAEEIAMAEEDRSAVLNFRPAKVSMREALVAAAQDAMVNCTSVVLARKVLDRNAAMRVRRLGAA